MRKIEEKILNEFSSVKNGYYGNKVKSINLSQRDIIKGFYENDGVTSVTYYLWDNPVFTFYQDKEEYSFTLSFCSWVTTTTLSRLRAFEKMFNFSIDWVKSGTYRVSFNNGQFIDIDDSNSHLKIKMDVSKNKMIANYF